MAKRKERVCARCGKIEETFSSTEYCRMCSEAIEREKLIEGHKKFILSCKYSILEEPYKDNNGHHRYKLKTPCGHEWEVKYGNFLKLIENAKAKNLPMPCGICGPKHRMKNALKAFVEKYSRDYDVNNYIEYCSFVRRTSEQVYKANKEIINPDNLRRGVKQYHLDHKFPIVECFKQGWSVEQAASVDNLQMLYWQDNLKKSGKIVE